MHTTNERRCIACRNHFLKKDLTRISSSEDGIIVGDSKKVNGRGVYLCQNDDCIDLCVKKRLLNRAFKKEVQQEIYDKIKMLKNNGVLYWTK